jgi:hypothetical protein
MKKNLVVSGLLIASSFFLLGFVTIGTKQSEVKKTEEYAMVEVIEVVKKKIIRTTIGEEPAQEKEWEKTKTDIEGDMGPVMKELNALNEKGFELVNVSLSYSVPTSSQGYSGPGYPRHTFMFKKKL